MPDKRWEFVDNPVRGGMVLEANPGRCGGSDSESRTKLVQRIEGSWRQGAIKGFLNRIGFWSRDE